MKIRMIQAFWKLIIKSISSAGISLIVFPIKCPEYLILFFIKFRLGISSLKES